jgi:hypothetical protein
VERERESLETEGRGGIRHTGLPLGKTRGPIMAPPSAARRSRGCAVRTDVDSGTRKGEIDYSAGIEMPLSDDRGRAVPLQAVTATNGTRTRQMFLLLNAELTVVLREGFAPQEREKARHVLGIKVPA